jgi:hypothetical protein
MEIRKRSNRQPLGASAGADQVLRSHRRFAGHGTAPERLEYLVYKRSTQETLDKRGSLKLGDNRLYSFARNLEGGFCFLVPAELNQDLADGERADPDVPPCLEFLCQNDRCLNPR